MSITAAELPALLDAIAGRAERAAAPAALAMARRFSEHASDVTLRRYSHPKYTMTPSPPGQPPAWVSGHLAGLFEVELAGAGGGWALAEAGPTAIYARIQELGGVIVPVHAKYLRFLTAYVTKHTAWRRVPGSKEKAALTDGGLFVNFAKRVYLPRRPYMRPTLDAVVADGSLERSAAVAFAAEVWG